MRALVFLLKLLMKILVAPVIFTLTLFVWICVGIVYVSGLVLGKVQDLKFAIQDLVYS